jgi:hypothetical protein
MRYERIRDTSREIELRQGGRLSNDRKSATVHSAPFRPEFARAKFTFNSNGRQMRDRAPRKHFSRVSPSLKLAGVVAHADPVAQP